MKLCENERALRWVGVAEKVWMTVSEREDGDVEDVCVCERRARGEEEREGETEIASKKRTIVQITRPMKNARTTS